MEPLNNASIMQTLGFGGAALSGDAGGYGFGLSSSAKLILDKCLELGITHIDTAPVYGYGSSEKAIGNYLKESLNRDKFIIATKAGVAWRDNKRIYLDLSPENIRAMIEQSLKRLSSEYIDVFYLHSPDKNVPLSVSLEEVLRLKEKGYFKDFGLSNYSLEQIKQAREIIPVSYVQFESNLFTLKKNRQLIEYCKQNKIKTVGWGSLDKGILSGSVDAQRIQRNDFEKSDIRSWAKWWRSSPKEDKFQVMEQLKVLIERSSDLSKNLKTENCLLALTLSSYLSLSSIDVALCGAKSVAQLTQLDKIEKEIKLTEDDLARVSDILSYFGFF